MQESSGLSLATLVLLVLGVLVAVGVLLALGVPGGTGIALRCYPGSPIIVGLLLHVEVLVEVGILV